MTVHPPPPGQRFRRDVMLEGEHPDVVLADVAGRPRPAARVIVVANEKGGVGKSTLAFHLAVALADAGLAVAAIDLDRRQQSLATALGHRAATAQRLRLALPQPRSQVLQIHSGSLLCQEVARVGWDADVVIIDAAGHDSPIARRAIALADLLLTPINGSFVDLDLLGRLDPRSHALLTPGCFARTVNELREARARHGLPGLDWVVVQNRTRRGASHNQDRFDSALAALAPALGFRVGQGLTERVAYRELFLLGLTHLDLRHIPDLARTRTDANREILALVADLAIALPPAKPQAPAPEPQPRAVQPA